MHIFLNGTKFELEGGVVRTAITEWSDNIRYDGQQQRKDRRYMSTWAFDNWTNGLGVQRWNVNLANKQNALWDAENVDTRNGQIVLAPAFVHCTVNPSRGDLDFLLDYDGQIYLAESTPEGTRNATIGYQYSTPSILGSKCAIGSSSSVGSPITGMFVDGKTIYGVGYNWNTSLNPHVFNVQGTISAAANEAGTLTPSGGFVLAAKFSKLGGTYHLLTHDGTNVMFTVLNGFGSLSQVGTFSGKVGSYLPNLQSDGANVYAQLPDGVYDFDSTPAKIIDTSRSVDKNGALDMFQNDLYFKNYRNWVKYDGTKLAAAGYDQQDGLPADKMGEITAVTSNWKYQYAAVKGATYSHIMTRDTNGVWQYYARVPSFSWVKDLILSSTPDGIDRLWVLFGNGGNPGYFLNPVVNPLQAGTYSYVPSGHFTPPHYDGGLPEHQAGFYRLAVTGRADATQGIRAYYGLDTADPVVTLGDVASHNQAFVMGSPNGLAAYSVQPKFMLYRGDPGTTPEFYSSVISYLKKPDIREQYDFIINLKETANSLKGQIPLEAVVGSLNYIRQLRTLVPFWYGYTGTRYVSIIDIPAAEQVNDARIREGEREGLIQIRAIEMTL